MVFVEQYWSLHRLSILLLLPLLFNTGMGKIDKFVSRDQPLELINFLRKIFSSDEMDRCSLQLYTYTEKIHKYTHSTLLHGLEDFTSNIHKSIETSGILVSDILSESVAEAKRYQQPKKINHAKRCSVVIIVIETDNFILKREGIVRTALLTPILYPPTVRNHDKYLIVTDEHTASNLQSSKLLKTLKFKLVLVLLENIKNVTIINHHQNHHQLQVYVKGVCQYGLCKQQLSTLTGVGSHLINEPVYSYSVLRSLFPDHERNFFGYTLRLSTTTKVPQLLELEVIKNANGGKDLYLPKRGLYATVLAELSKRLNFTYEILPSSGNGSTGHALPNGTWVGIVGDTYKGIVDFGLMAAVTYQRFPYAEFCAPINFAYLGFVTGPPRKSYAWNAILWPFKPTLWVGVALTVLVAAKLMITTITQSYVLDDEGLISLVHKAVKWSYLKGISFLVQGLLGQCPEIPKQLKNYSFRTFLTFWLLFCLVVTTAYSCKMVSLLTFPSYDRIPDSFDELALAKDFAIDFHYFGNVGFAYFRTSTNPSFIKIFKRMGREPSPLKCLQRTLDEKAACIIFILTFEELLHRNLSDQYGESPLKFTRHEGAMFPAGVIHEYNAPLSSNFKSLLFPAMETGLIPFWQQTDLNKVLENKNRWQKANKIDINAAIWGSDVDDNLLRVRNLKGAFITFVVGIIAAVLAFIVEKIKRKSLCGYISTQSLDGVQTFRSN